MPYRKTPLVDNEVYHVFNRGIAKLPIFSESFTYSRLVNLIEYYRFRDTPASFSLFKKLPRDEKQQILDNLRKENILLVEILGFCLMNNHYHFLLKQISNNGITKFISNIQNAYAKYFNIKTQRVGPLFQPMFKAVRVITDEQLLHVSRYIHLNPSTGYLVKIEDLEKYHWSSLNCYLNDQKTFVFVNTKLVLGLFRSRNRYRSFIFNQAEYQRELGRLKHLYLE